MDRSSCCCRRTGRGACGSRPTWLCTGRHGRAPWWASRPARPRPPPPGGAPPPSLSFLSLLTTSAASTRYISWLIKYDTRNLSQSSIEKLASQSQQSIAEHQPLSHRISRLKSPVLQSPSLGPSFFQFLTQFIRIRSLYFFFTLSSAQYPNYLKHSMSQSLCHSFPSHSNSTVQWLAVTRLSTLNHLLPISHTLSYLSSPSIIRPVRKYRA
jgi:hypothetical protein